MSTFFFCSHAVDSYGHTVPLRYYTVLHYKKFEITAMLCHGLTCRAS